MDENNNQTSVVIALANLAESENQNMNQIDLNDLCSSKDYVVDQIFCGDNITVYAMFEAEEDEKTSEKPSTGVEEFNWEDIQLYGAKSYRRGFLDGLKNRGGVNSLRKINRSESLYSLRGYGENSESFTSLSGINTKILFSEEYYPTNSEGNKSPKELKKASKGVNTDIAFCPKLIEDVCHALSVNFLGSNKKPLENSPTDVPILAKGLIQPEESSIAYISNFDLDKKKVQKPSREFLFVPLMMTEEEMLKQNQHKNNKPYKKETRQWKCKENSEKNSSVHNTELEFSNKEKIDCSQWIESEEFNCSLGARKKVEKNPCQESILAEIKLVHWKLNTLIQSLENQNSESIKNDANESKEMAKEKKAEEIFPNEGDNVMEKGFNLTETETETKISPVLKTNLKDELIFSALNNLQLSKKVEKIQNGSILDRSKTRKLLMDSSESTSSSVSTNNTFSLKNSLETSNTTFKCVEIYDFQSKVKTNKRGTIGLSKSDSNVRLNFPNFNSSYFQGRKRSQSLDLGEDKPDLMSNRKLKNFSFNQENCLKVKTNVRTHQTRGNSIHENLTLDKCEMGGDEMIVKQRKSNLLEAKTNAVKETKVLNAMDKDVVEVQSSKKNKEEDYRNLKYQKRRLYLPQLPYKNEKLVDKSCHSNPSSLGKLSKNQSFVKDKLGIKTLRTNSENRKKLTIEKEKSSGPSQKPTENGIKKEVKAIKNALVKKGAEKFVKKDGAIDSAKQKLLNRVVKSSVKSVPESKSQKEKAKRETSENKVNMKTEGLVKHKDKSTEKYDLLSTRSPSQLRRRHVGFPFVDETKEKTVLGLNRKSPRLSVFDEDMEKNSLEGILHTEKTNQILVFDKKADDLLPGSVVDPSANNQFFLPESSPVVVELFSKKPPTLKAFDFDSNGDTLNKNSLHGIFSTDANLSNTINHGGNSDSSAKPIVRSVWALTKVLLYDDGSKKFEILEASLTPPDYFLNNENLKQDIIR